MTSWYVPRPVPADLRGDLVCTWTATPAGEHRLVPDGCVDVVWPDDADDDAKLLGLLGRRA